MMHLYQQYSAIFSDHKNAEIKKDFIQMHVDLKTLYPDAENTHGKTVGYRFADMFASIVGITDIVSAMQQVDLCILINSTPEFDPYFSHIGTYLMDHYHFCFDLIDFSESTQFPLYKAISLMRSYFLLGHISRAAILCFEQRGSLTYMPESNLSDYQNAVSALFFSADCFSGCSL